MLRIYTKCSTIVTTFVEKFDYQLPQAIFNLPKIS